MKKIVTSIFSFFGKVFRRIFCKEKVIIATCVYLVRDGYVLMGNQQKTILGFKGYGGKVKFGQTISQNVVEELWEETGGVPSLRVNKDEEGGIIIREEWLEKVAIIRFFNNHTLDKPLRRPSFIVNFFICRKFFGNPIDTVEMKDHQLFNINHLPIEKMVKGDDEFVLQILNGKFLKGDIVRNEHWEIIKNTLRECSRESLDL